MQRLSDLRRTLSSPLPAMLAAVLAALLLTSAVLWTSGVSALEAFQLVFFGAFSTPKRLSDMIMLAAPLLLCAIGLTVTFAGGLYNLGIEGQVIAGAVGAMVPLRLLPEAEPLVVWILSFGTAALAAAGWAMVIAVLRRYAGVSEIFAGLGMNFLASGMAMYLVLGPWRREGSSSLSGTEMLDKALWLPTLDALRLAPAAPVLALTALLLVALVLTRTRWGLEVRAVGLNAAAAARLGVPAAAREAQSLALAGALAGLAGALQVLAVHHMLIPNIASGIGLIGLLVALLVGARTIWLLPVSVAFAAFTVGAIQLPLALNIDSSIAGVLQGALVLFALLARRRAA